jgi:hypothetical protein
LIVVTPLNSKVQDIYAAREFIYEFAHKGAILGNWRSTNYSNF